ncbi:type II toxin-antitoxin system VapC family toxin [Devosia sp. ZB163]|uniref:type II toxin-antitoxin system VapC family toxin n=1 Tax=Devosia sp. ZB163 TaxID=3025938 RepID=UPI00235F3242|nr:type II toxin-antitoxin system VapC family toxin [Devosia sp. ZB163]MDC9824151.1 type II toxin-antitoxin system VapC family toxin [Devosia sp. ZB163]
MIALDTSALLAIVLNEPMASGCTRAVTEADRILISAGTMAEALMVAQYRLIGDEMRDLLARLDIEVIPVTQVVAERVASASRRWGKGVHPAGLNYGDCFAYALAEEYDCPLLYIGNDFAQTDIRSAL